MSEQPPTKVDPLFEELGADALALLSDLARLAVDLDEPRTQQALDEALGAAYERVQSWL